MARIIRSPESLDDLAQIFDYIALHNTSAAERWLDAVDRLLVLVASQPLIGESIDSLEPGLRRFVLGRYVIFYEPHKDGIVLHRVLHGARNIEDLFG
jgi:toxin ParE1/3/4